MTYLLKETGGPEAQDFLAFLKILLVDVSYSDSSLSFRNKIHMLSGKVHIFSLLSYQFTIQFPLLLSTVLTTGPFLSLADSLHEHPVRTVRRSDITQTHLKWMP